MYRRFGAEVTVVERAPRLIAREDEDVSDAVRSILEGEGISVRTSAKCISLARHEQGVAVSVDCADGPPEAIGSHVLLAVGRRPNTDDLGLDRAGVRPTLAAISLLTRAWPPMSRGSGRSATATAAAPSRIRLTTISRSSPQICSTVSTRELRERIPAYALYIDPPLGRVGMTEAEARASGRPLLTAKRPMTRVGRAVEKGETRAS